MSPVVDSPVAEREEFSKLLGASEEIKIDHAFDEIATALLSGQAQFLFGAGMSLDSGLPLMRQLTVSLLEEFFAEPVRNGELTKKRLAELATEFPAEAIVHAVEHKSGSRDRTGLTSSLKAIFLDPKIKPNEGHKAFSSLLGTSPRLRSIFTTNYDTLIEEELGIELAETITDKDAANIQSVRDSGKIPVIHLRGTLNGDYGITEPDILSDNFRVLISEFRTALHSAAAFVFVGFSLSDIDFRRWHREFENQDQTRRISGKTTYFVGPPTDQFSYALGTRIWELRSAIWIPLSAKEFFLRLKKVADNRTLQDIRRQVRNDYGVNDAQLDDLMDQTSKLWRMTPQDALLFLYEARTRIGGAS
jgi:hypothetical protein